MLTREELWFWFCNINGIGHKKMSALLGYYGDVASVFSAKEQELRQIECLTLKDREYLSTTHKEESVKRIYSLLDKHNVRFLTQEDSEYPNRLRSLYDAPYGIYLKGTLPKEQKRTIGIVGARNCTNYGKEVAIHFAKELAKRDVQIISGLAIGIDGYSHEGALAGKGYTLGILGSGINVCYPKSNQRLYHTLEEEGGILSEYGLHVSPKAGNFPRRNRLIAAMSDGILVVEASKKSGSFITVDQGLEQGKDIFVIPGRITDELSIGCNQLVKSGAEVVCSPEELFDYYHMEYLKEEKDIHNNIMLTDEEKSIVSVLSTSPLHISDIATKTNFTICLVMDRIFQLERRGLVKQVVKNFYVIEL